MKHLVQWGAGNIGRSFIGQIFARNGCGVTFIDIQDSLVEALNREGGYKVITLSDKGNRTMKVEGVSACHGGDKACVEEAVVRADYLSFSVGKNILPRIAAQAAAAVAVRYRRRPEAGLDILIAENIQDGAEYLRSLLVPHLPEGFPVDGYLGFVETSLGKMVPLQSGDDPLTLYAEEYNTLILDRRGFIGEVPEYPEIKAVEPIKAYVAEKLYIHNLGHAAAAYLGFKSDPSIRYIWEAVGMAGVREQVRLAMEQAGKALRREFPGVFTRSDLTRHIDDLLYRFSNRALGDTVYRVGRDIQRKLHKTDRVLGAILLAEKHGMEWDRIGRVFLAALQFGGKDEDGNSFSGDRRFLEGLSGMSLEEKICAAGGLAGPASSAANSAEAAPADPLEERVIRKLKDLG